MAGINKSLQALANAVWSLVAVSARTVRVVRSVQYISTVLDRDTTSDTLAPGVAFTDYTKVVLFPATVMPTYAGLGGTYYNVRWAVLSNTNITVYHDAPGGSGGTEPLAAAWAVEFY